MPSRFQDYRVRRGDDIGDPDYWNRRLKDLDARIASNEDQRSTLEEVIDEGRTVFRDKANDVLLPLIKEVSDVANLGALLRATSATEHDVTVGGKVFVIDEGQRLRFAAPAYVAVYRMDSPQAAMLGEVVSYDSGTGELTVDVDRVSGTGYGGGWMVTVVSPSDTAEAIAGVLAARTATEAARDQATTARDEAVVFRNDAETARDEANAFAASASTDAGRSEAAIVTLQGIYDAQSQIYLGAFAADPVADLNGDPLVEGAEYWNTVDGVKKIYGASGWTVSYVPVGSEVTSIFGRTGNVGAQLGDYSADKITRADGAGGVAGATAEAALIGLKGTVDTKADAAATTAALGAKADKATTVSGGGLATGGGDLSANRTITVTAATQPEAEAGLLDTRAMTPLKTKQAIDALVPAATTTQAGKARFATTAEALAGLLVNVATDPATVKAVVDAAVSNLVSAAPGALDTLNELAAAIGDDPNFAATISAQIGQKLNSSAVSAWILANLLGVADAAGARTAMGLGSAATMAASAFLAAAAKAADSDLLDGQDSTFYRNIANMTAGTLAAARFADSSHGSRAGGSLHAAATALVNGFMSAADKSKLDGITLDTGTVANTVAKRDGSGDITARLMRSTYADAATAVGALMGRVNATDNYLRPITLAAVADQLVPHLGALANEVGLYTGTSSSETNYPVGHIVAVTPPSTFDYNTNTYAFSMATINSTATIRVQNTTSFSRTSGTALSGTWRCRGGLAVTNLSPGGAFELWQRVA